MLIAAAAVAFTACQKEINQIETSNDGEFVYNFAINNTDNESSINTRAALSDDGTNLFLKWENGDSFGAFATDGSSNSNNRPSTVAVSGDTYTLKVASTVELKSGSTVYAYFPYNSGAGTNKTSATIKIDPVQTQKSTGFDASVMPMVGEPYTTTTTLVKDEETTVGEIKFANLGAIVEFNIYATSTISEQIKSVEFNSTSGNLAGNYTVDLTAVDFSDASTLALQGSGSAASVKTDLVTPVAIPVSTTAAKEGTKVYMSIAPGSYTGTIVVTTTGHTYTFNVSSAKTFNRSKVKRLNANLSNAIPGDLPVEETWEVITSTTEFTAGTYVIVSSDKASYLVNEAKGKNPSSAAAHWDASGNLTSVTDDAKWIATASGSGLQFASYANTSNLLWMSTSTAQGVSVATSAGSESIPNQAKVWTLVENTTLGGDSGYIATTGNNRYLALYTNGTWRGYTITATGTGAGYLSGNSNIMAAVFYKLVDNRTALDAPVLTVSGTVVSWSAIANAGSYKVTIGSNEYSINTTSVDLDDYSLSDGEYTVTVVAVPSNSTLFKNSAAASTSVIIGNPAGTSTNPYTVSQALTEADKLTDGSTTDNEVYVSGIVSGVTSYNSTYKSITYNISADGTTTDQLLIYGGLDIEGSDFASIYDLAVGDAVVVKGLLKKYGTTLEMDKDNHVISNTKATRYTVTLGSVSNGTISASTNSAGAQAVITLTATPATGYALDKWTVTNASTSEVITVSDNSFTMPAANVNVTATFTTSSESQVTLQYTTNTTTNMTGNNDAASVGLDANKWSVVGAQGGHTLYPGLNKNGYIALYYHADGNNSITVSSLNNSTINSITITYTSDSYSNCKVYVGDNEVSISNGSYPINGTSFVIKNANTSSAQVRIRSIVINYTPAN